MSFFLRCRNDRVLTTSLIRLKHREFSHPWVIVKSIELKLSHWFLEPAARNPYGIKVLTKIGNSFRTRLQVLAYHPYLAETCGLPGGYPFCATSRNSLMRSRFSYGALLR